jgi:DNA-binding transcriptional ArsR family regulator
MMAKENFILVSLKEEESKQLAQVISNDTSRKVLDYLAEKEATESELAEKLEVPISTVHYNLQALVKGKLVVTEEFHYSKKGKEVLHYKLANKYIIIAPKSTYGIREKLKTILPVGFIALAGAAVIEWFNTFGGISARFAKQTTEAVADTAVLVQPVMEEAARTGAEATKAATIETVPNTAANVIQSQPNYALWFLIGCIFTLVIIIIVDWFRNRNK